MIKVLGHRSVSRRIQPFTILEVVVAIGIFAVGLVGALGFTAASTHRMNKAMRRWERQHLLVQATEYFMLTGPGSSVPQEFFPYDDYSVQCDEMEPDDLPEGIEPKIDNWSLVKYKIVLKDDSGEELESIEFDKLKNDDIMAQ